MSDRQRLGGMSTLSAATHGTQYRPYDSIPFPSNSIAAGASLESFDLPQPLRDIGLVLLGALTSGSFIAAFAIVLFVRIG